MELVGTLFFGIARKNSEASKKLRVSARDSLADNSGSELQSLKHVNQKL